MAAARLVALAVASALSELGVYARGGEREIGMSFAGGTSNHFLCVPAGTLIPLAKFLRNVPLSPECTLPCTLDSHRGIRVSGHLKGQARFACRRRLRFAFMMRRSSASISSGVGYRGFAPGAIM